MFVGDLLREIIDEVKPRLEALDPDVAAAKPPDGKWSRKEILGHLVDSAACNHRRFVLASTKDDLVFDGYDQDHWVTVQKYQDRPWHQIVDLWHAYNTHLSDVMGSIPAAIRTRVYANHNFDKIAMRAVPSYTRSSLEYLMRDYVWHLEHHITQILPDYVRRFHWK